MAWVALVPSKVGRRTTTVVPCIISLVRFPAARSGEEPELDGAPNLTRPWLPNRVKIVVDACAVFFFGGRGVRFPTGGGGALPYLFFFFLLALHEKGRADRGSSWGLPLKYFRNLGETGPSRWSGTGWPACKIGRPFLLPRWNLPHSTIPAQPCHPATGKWWWWERTASAVPLKSITQEAIRSLAPGCVPQV